MLAKFTCNLDEDGIWIEDYPPIVRDLIQEEKVYVNSVIE